MIKLLKSAWLYLDGKKSVISALVGVALSWAQATNKLDGTTAVYLTAGLSALTGVAVGHKAVKAKVKQRPFSPINQ